MQRAEHLQGGHRRDVDDVFDGGHAVDEGQQEARAVVEGQPAQVILDEAKRIAMESNTLSSRESDLERANYYRRMLEMGTPASEIKAAAARMEGKEAVKILAFAQLNPNGKTANALRPIAQEFQGGLSWSGTVYPSHAIELAKQAAQEGCDMIIAMGGDGTFREVVRVAAFG